MMDPRRGLSLLVFAGLLFLSCGREEARPASPSAAFPERVHDFGKVVQGTRVEHAFPVLNRGSADLVIDRFDAARGLSVKHDKVIPAGGRSTILLTLDTTGLRGQGEAAVRLHTNDPAAPQKVIALVGTVLQTVEVAPAKQAYFFGLKGSGGEKRFTLIHHGDRPLTVGRVASDNPWFKASVRPEVPGQRYLLSVFLDPATPAGRHEGTVTVATDSPAEPEVKISVRAALEDLVAARPDRVHFGLLRAEDLGGDVALRKILVARHQGKGFEVLGAESDIPFLSIEVAPEKPGEIYLVSVRVDGAKARKGEIRGALTVRTNDPAFPRVEVPVTGRIL
jgi:hypothetical protein